MIWHIKNIMEIMASGFREAGRRDLTPDTMHLIIIDYIFKGFIVLFPLLLTVLVAALIGNVAQVGFMFSTESIQPKISAFSTHSVEHLHQKYIENLYCWGYRLSGGPK